MISKISDTKLQLKGILNNLFIWLATLYNSIVMVKCFSEQMSLFTAWTFIFLLLTKKSSKNTAIPHEVQYISLHTTNAIYSIYYVKIKSGDFIRINKFIKILCNKPQKQADIVNLLRTTNKIRLD